MTSYLNTINSEGVDLVLNNTSGQAVVIGNSLTSILGSRTFGASTIGAITGTSATFSSTVTTSGLLTASAGFTSTAGATTLGASTIGAITGTSISLSSTLGVSGLITAGNGLTSTAGTTTLGASTIGAITGTSATFSSTVTTSGLLTANSGFTSTAGSTTLGASTIGAITGTSATFSNTVTANGSLVATSGFTSTAGSTTLGASTIGEITGTSATFSSTLTASNGFVSTAGSTTLGASTIGSITGTSATFSSTLTASNGFVSTAGSTTLGASTIGAITGTSATFSNTVTANGSLVAASGFTSTAGSTTLGASTIGAITGTSATFSNTVTTNGSLVAASGFTSTAGTTTLGASTIGAITGTSATFSSTVTTSGLLTANSGFTSTAGTTTLGTTNLQANIAMGNNKITGLGTPTSATDAVTKAYVDSVSSGTSAKTSVKVATTVAGTLSTSFQDTSVVDGVTLVTNYRILIKNQADPIENGIYIVNATGSPTRANDFLVGSNQAGTYVFVEEGTVNDNAGFICNSSSGSDLVGTDNITFSQFTGAAQINAGTGLTKSGNTLSVNSSQTQITLLGTLSSLTVSGNSSLFSGSFSDNLGVSGTFTATSATFSGAITANGSLTANSGFTSTAGATTLGASTIGAITGTSATFSGAVTANGSLTATSGFTSTAGSTTLGASTIGAITGTSATFSSTLTASNGFTSTTGSTTLGASTIGAITGTSATFSGAVTANGSLTATSGFTSTAGSTTLGATTIGAITGTSASFSSTVGISGILTNTNTTDSTSSSTGSVLLSGGLGISNVTDAISSTNGGSITSAGGLAIAKKAFIGTSLETGTTTSSTGFLVRGSTSGTISILPQANAGTYNFNLPTTPGTTGQILASAGGSGAPMTWVTPAVSSAPQTYSVTGLQSQGSPVDVSGLVYTDGFFEISMTVEIVATTNLKQLFKLSGILSPSSGWDLLESSLSGDDSLVTFSISAGGNVRYTSGTYPGFVSLTFTWAQFSTTQGINYLALSGTSSGIVTVAPQANAGTFNFNLPITPGSSGDFLTSGGGGSTAMTWSSGTSTGTGNLVRANAPTFSGDISMGNFKITGLGTPTVSTDAVTKAYVDSVSSGTSAKTSVRVATTVAGTLASSFANGSTVDGITLVTGMRILIKNQTNAVENGIYTVNVSGAPSRANDFLSGSNQGGTYLFVEEGTVNDNQGYICNSSSGSDLVGTNNITFSKFTGSTGGSSIQTYSATGLQSQASPVNVTGLSYVTSSFNIVMIVDIIATTSLKQVFRLSGVNSPSSGWSITVLSETGDDSLVDFSISSGNVRYTSGSYPGFVSLTFTWSDFSTTQGINTLSLAGSSSGAVTIAPQANAGTFNFNLPVTAGTTGQVLASGGGAGNPMTWVNQANPQTFSVTGLQTQASPINVTGLVYSSGFFDINMTVTILATTNLTQLFRLTGILSPSSGWSVTPISISGDDTLVDFSISAGGNIQYTSGTYAGFTSLTFTWAQVSSTQGVNLLSLAGSTSGAVTIAPQANAGTFNFNLPTTSGSSGDVLLSGGGSSNPMTWSGTTGTGTFVRSVAPTLTGNVNTAQITNSGNITTGTLNSGPIVSSSSVKSTARISSLGYQYNSASAGAYSINPDLNVINKRIKSSRADAIRSVSNWTTSTVPSGSWTANCWSPELGLFLICNNSSSNTCQTSPDGINWTSRTFAATITAWGACWSPELGLFVVTNNATSTDAFQTSPDGINWTTRTTGANQTVTGICWSPELGIFVACAGAGGVLVSSNGTTWNNYNIGTSSGNGRVCWSPELSRFVLTNQTIGFYYSGDGISWTVVPYTGLLGGSPIHGICWSPELSIFVACSQTASTSNIATSPDGINWTNRTSPTSVALNDILWAPEISMFITSNGLSSPNGITWVSRSIPANGYTCSWSPELGVFLISILSSTLCNVSYNMISGTFMGNVSKQLGTSVGASLAFKRTAAVLTINNASGTVLNCDTAYTEQTTGGSTGFTYSAGRFTNASGSTRKVIVTAYIPLNSSAAGGVFGIATDLVVTAYRSSVPTNEGWLTTVLSIANSGWLQASIYQASGGTITTINDPSIFPWISITLLS